ncbi:MAG TPA: metallophosphoesterase, partial [Opitutaceae bacterium]|nr:metallophosphoesterase [Opitutaceae bacterium]
MHLLHVSDLHFRRPWFHWLRNDAPAHDALVISGDLLDHRLPDVPAQMAWVGEWLQASPVPVVVSSGNHDLEWDAARYRWQPAYWLRRLSPPVYPDGTVLEHGSLALAPIACTQHPRSAAADGWVVHTP